MNEKYDPQKALKLAVMLGAALMENGAEIYRVEESIIHVLRAYGLKRIDVYALPNIIIVTMRRRRMCPTQKRGAFTTAPSILNG